MKNCKYYKEKLLSNVFFNNDNSVELVEHINKCSECKEYSLDLQNVHKRPDVDIAEDRLDSVLAKIEQIKKQEEVTVLKKALFLNNVISLMKKRGMIILPVLLLCLLLPIMNYLFIGRINQNFLDVVSVHGDVKVNELRILKGGKSRINIRHKADINVLDGEFIARLNDNKLLYICENTDASISVDKNILTLEIYNGMLMSKTLKTKKGCDCFVKAGESIFQVIGTIFLVDKKDKSTRVSVYEGEVEFQNGDEPVLLTDSEAIEVFFNPDGKDNFVLSRLSHEDFVNFNKIINIGVGDNLNENVKNSNMGTEIKAGDGTWGLVSDVDSKHIFLNQDSIHFDRRCLMVDYDFNHGARFELYKDVDVSLEGIKYISFYYYNSNPLNKELELGIVGGDGNYYYKKLETLPIIDDWQKLVVDIAELKLAKGENQTSTKDYIKKISLKLTKNQAGKSRMGISELSFSPASFEGSFAF